MRDYRGHDKEQLATEIAANERADSMFTMNDELYYINPGTGHINRLTGQDTLHEEVSKVMTDRTWGRA